MAPSPEEQAAAMIENMPGKTGKSLDDWLVIARASKLVKHGEIVKHLKEAHGLGHGYANLVAHKLLQSDAASVAESGDLVEMQYAGEKAPLRPLYDAIVGAVRGFGPDVEAAPKKAYVSLRRSKQFAIVQPSTKSRLDLGINLKGRESGPRLEASGSFNTMVSHRVRLEKLSDVDAELIGWLREAYAQA